MNPLNKDLHLSTDGDKLIKGFEQFRPTAYQDSGGKWTYGWGATFKLDGSAVKKGDTISMADADILFDKNILKFENQVKAAITIPLKQNEFDAVVSAFYNALGVPRFIQHINERDNMALVFPLYDKDQSGNVSPGLLRRRKSEAEMFVNGKLNFFEHA